jgi:hypothetical protein
MSRFMPRLIALAIVAAALTVPQTLLTASPAQAHTCSPAHSRSFTADDGVARAQVTFYPRCGDGRSHWHGTVWDTLCDARAGRFYIIANPIETAQQWGHHYNVPNGCGTSTTFSGSDQYVGVVTTWHVVVGVLACNWRCSDRTDRHIYYYN